MFKWNANVNMQPDLDDIREHCKENKSESYFLDNYQELIYYLKGINIKEQSATQQKVAKKGSKAEFLNYLIAEVGDQIEISWRCPYFYLTGEIKTEDFGDFVQLLSLGNLI